MFSRASSRPLDYIVYVLPWCLWNLLRSSSKQVPWGTLGVGMTEWPASQLDSSLKMRSQCSQHKQSTETQHCKKLTWTTFSLGGCVKYEWWLGPSSCYIIDDWRALLLDVTTCVIFSTFTRHSAQCCNFCLFFTWACKERGKSSTAIDRAMPVVMCEVTPCPCSNSCHQWEGCSHHCCTGKAWPHGEPHSLPRGHTAANEAALWARLCPGTQ